MVHVIHEQQQESAAAAHENLPCAPQRDLRPDRHTATIYALTVLGAHEQIIAEALMRRPTLTAQQVQDTWAWYQWRIAQSQGRLGEGLFFAAIRQGQIHAAPPNRAAPIDAGRYTGGSYGDLFRRGGDTSDLEVLG